MAIYQTYSIKSGDTLGAIAQRFDTTVNAIVALNGLPNPNAIEVEQELRIKQISETYYTVKSGDTLSGIAANRNVTVAQILAANGLRDANKLSVGQKLIIPSPGPAETASSISPMRELGNLSRKYEVGNRGPGTVSGGVGDPGGVSYGSYQLASKLGNAGKFLKDEGERWASEFGSSKEGTDAFSATWKAIALREPTLFHDAQHDYIQRTHFEPQVAKIKSLSGIDVTQRSRALMDVVWSCAVQHGPSSSLIGDVLSAMTLPSTDPSYDRQAIIAIYGERGRTDADGTLVRFSRSSAAVQSGVAKRFRNELNDALAMLESETTLSAITPPPDASREESRALLLKAQKSLTDQEVHTLIERYGDLEAKTNFLSGQKVVIALRNPTDSKKYHKGTFDDPFLLVSRNGDGAVTIKRYMGNTEPARIYAWGQAKQSKGSGTDLDGDGRNDLGRLRAGTYHYSPRVGDFLGAKAFRARSTQVCMRDTNQDGNFSLLDGDGIDETGAQRSMLLHRGGSGHDTWSAGCQTITNIDYGRFLSALGSQDHFSYVLINVE